MQLFPTKYDDPLNGAALPPPSKTEPELNYRTRPLTGEDEMRLLLLVMIAPVPFFITLASILNGLIRLYAPIELLTLSVIYVLAGVVTVRMLVGARVRRETALFIVLGSVYFFSCLWVFLDGLNSIRIGILLAWLTSGVIARQVCAWILVGPKVDRERMDRWRFNIPGILLDKLSLDCPELLTFGLSPLLLTPAWWLATWCATNVIGRAWTWPFCFVASLHLAWFLLHAVTVFFVPWPSWWKSLRMTLLAASVFITYDVHQTPAAGIFRFPDRWLRSVVVRWVLIIVVVMILAFACASSWPNLLANALQGGSLLGQLVLNIILVTIQAPLLLLTILWFTAGALLARFDDELTKNPPDGLTEWDNYVDRIINSEDELESEHVFVGTSQVGDYPILVHKEIYDQHMHLLGDTGASKTSLGIAPLATQLIAREDSTVVIVDLKGDRALFEACRREAARTRKLRFRWVSNEVGHTSFSFNPFLQSHNQNLSTEQFVQEILQGLSLDYGIAYGAGYFTAMNEIVLNTVLKNVRARSFRELNKHLVNQRFYSKIGHAEDWAQARHLGALVSRMAATEAINIVPGMYSGQPDVLSQAIDATNVFNEPQVVYLWLRSAIEPTNAPAIARLFLWAMFSAASHMPRGDQRVYFLIDEFQQVISEGIKLIFEQFRDLGGTILAAHQTAGQLRRQGSDLAETIDSCTAVKQVFRASDLESLERLEKLSGSFLAKVAYWLQPHETGTGELIDRLDVIHADEGMVNVRQVEQPRVDRRRLLEIGANRTASLIRFTSSSGYTQFAGATVPIISQFPIGLEEYKRRRTLGWPQAPGAFTVPPAGGKQVNSNSNFKPSESSSDFVAEFDRRSGRAVGKRT